MLSIGILLVRYGTVLPYNLYNSSLIGVLTLRAKDFGTVTGIDCKKFEPYDT